jgi:2-hydroxychromene-2-carboxylate isomerase
MSGAGRPLDFWFSIGSTYTYLSVMRLPSLAAAAGVSVRWRPFSVRRIMREMDNRFLAGKPEKYAYMWRDIARRAAAFGLQANVPVPHPIAEFDLANRVAVLGMREGWGEQYVQGTFRRWFQDRSEPGQAPNLKDTLAELGLDPTQVIEQASDQSIGVAYDTATDEARALGIFGSPNFVVEGELFWGDDRLEDALNWHRHGTVAATPPAL